MWNNNAEFILSCISYGVGLGNLWRFPYLCFKHGGFSFLVPYWTCLVLCGLPLSVLENTLGQYSGHTPGELFQQFPLFKGVGWAMVLIDFGCTFYYSRFYITWPVLKAVFWSSQKSQSGEIMIFRIKIFRILWFPNKKIFKFFFINSSSIFKKIKFFFSKCRQKFQKSYIFCTWFCQFSSSESFKKQVSTPAII